MEDQDINTMLVKTHWQEGLDKQVIFKIKESSDLKTLGEIVERYNLCSYLAKTHY